MRSVFAHIQKLAFRSLMKMLNWYYDLYIDGNKRPVIFNIDTEFPQLRLLEDIRNVILQEYNAASVAFTLPEYHEIDSHQYAISGMNRSKWKIFILSAAGQSSPQAEDICPQTCETLRLIPDTIQAFFSVLEPGKSIPAHKGPFRGQLRYHLTLKAPAVNPPYIRIKDHIHTWENGNSILFDDSWEHEVINQAMEDRIVLIVDVLRPMPGMAGKLNKWLLRRVIANTYARLVLRNQRNTLKPAE